MACGCKKQNIAIPSASPVAPTPIVPTPLVQMNHTNLNPNISPGRYVAPPSQ